MNQMIFDVGMHKGEDTAYYLARGYRVVAIDADPAMIQDAKNRFVREVHDKTLVLLNYAMTDKDDDTVMLQRSKYSAWSSLKNQISNRGGYFQDELSVPTRRLSTLIREFGMPQYCKIDIEGYDPICLETLTDLPERPRFISAEVECVGQFETLNDEQALAVLVILNRLGYSKFKLVDQNSLSVLKPGIPFYRERSRGEELLKTMNVLQLGTRRRALKRRFGFDFPEGGSGPFGDDLDGEWLDLETARNCLLFHRKAYFRLPSALSFGFWCDWHAAQ